MTLLDKTLGGILVGLGAGMLLPATLASVGSLLRPLASGLIKGGIIASDRVRGLAQGAMEQLNDLVAGVQAENSSAGSRPAAAPRLQRPHPD